MHTGLHELAIAVVIDITTCIYTIAGWIIVSSIAIIYIITLLLGWLAPPHCYIASYIASYIVVVYVHCILQ